MNEAENERLLKEVFAQADLREALLGETLRRVRRRRHFRQTRRATAVAVALGLVATLVWRNVPQRPTPAVPVPRPAQQACGLVPTQPFPASGVVTTRPFSGAELAEPTSARVEIVQTTHGHYRLINDEQLLALVAPLAGALVRVGPHSERLVFANAAEGKGFPAD